MKHVYTFLFSILSIGLFAQISITKFSMPDVGNTLRTYSTIAPGLDLGMTEGPHEWDFTSLGKDLLNEIDLEDPSTGTVTIPNATFLIKSNDVVEQYYQKTDASIEEIHLKTVDPVFQSFEISNSYGANPVYRKGSIEYGATYESQSRFEAPLAWSVLPDTITDGIPLAPDSIRFNTVITRQDVIDAYGVVKLPDGDWDALRESTTTERKVTIDIFFFGAWIEAPAEILEAALGDFSEFLAPDTSYSVNFYTDKAIEVLASIELDDDGNSNAVTFKAGSEITEIYNPDFDSNPDVNIYPNPTFGNVSFTFENCRPGTYSIKVYDVLGKTLWDSEYLLKDQKKPYKVDLSHLQKGTYLYTIYDPRGNKITTKRLVIVTP
ncbi:T9SS type A sorting domain-containing protein [Saprospiraceae bacterium]|nr:T9SS type A sorting domain-containing protein [Saprospiraceae bacterium]